MCAAVKGQSDAECGRVGAVIRAQRGGIGFAPTAEADFFTLSSVQGNNLGHDHLMLHDAEDGCLLRTHAAGSCPAIIVIIKIGVLQQIIEIGYFAGFNLKIVHPKCSDGICTGTGVDLQRFACFDFDRSNQSPPFTGTGSFYANGFSCALFGIAAVQCAQLQIGRSAGQGGAIGGHIAGSGVHSWFQSGNALYKMRTAGACGCFFNF